MKKMMLSLMLVSGLFAEWTVVDKVDDFTDKKEKYVVYNDKKHKIQISKSEDNQIWFYIQRKELGHIEPNTIIELRVDKNKTTIINPLLLAELTAMMKTSPLYEWEPDIVGFMICAKKVSMDCPFVSNIITGKELKIRYSTSKFEKETFTIDLIDSDKLIKKALEI
jgi:hypothetical protein